MGEELAIITTKEKGRVVIVGKYDVSEYQWEQIKDEIAPKTSTCGRARGDPRELINAIVWVARTGSPWCEMPDEYGAWHTAYNNFSKWTKDGTMRRIFEKVMPKCEETREIQLDGTYICAHQHSAGIKKFKMERKDYTTPAETDGKIVRSRGGLTSKIHAVVDGGGKPMRFIITYGNEHDSTQAIPLMKHIIRKGMRVWGDRAYDSAKILVYIA